MGTRTVVLRIILRGLAALALVAFSAAGVAADSVHNTQAGFLSALTGTPNFQSFEGLTPTNTLNLNSLALAGFTMTSIGANTLGVNNINVLGAMATDGTVYVRWVAGSITFTFSSAISAFGFTLTDPLDGGARPILNMTTNGGSSVPGILTGLQPSGAALFVGFIGTNPFTQITFTSANTVQDGIGIDGVYFQAPPPPPPPVGVPEPATLTLLSAGFGLVLTSRIRRKV